MATQNPHRLALVALDVGAFGFMRLYGRDGAVRTPGLILAENDRANALVERVPVVQRLALRESISTELLALGAAALERASAGRSLIEIDALMSQLAEPGEQAVTVVTERGRDVEKIAHEDAIKDLQVEVGVQSGAVTIERRFLTGGAPRDSGALRLRVGGMLLWLDISGSVDPGPRPAPDPRKVLEQLKDDGIEIKRAFQGSLWMRGPRAAPAPGSGMRSRRPRRSPPTRVPRQS